MAESVLQNPECAQRGIDGIEIFNLLVQLAVGCGIEFVRSLALRQNLDEQCQKIEVLLGGRKRERIDLEVFGFKSHGLIRAAAQLRQALESSTPVKYGRMRGEFLLVRQRKIQKELLPDDGTPKL